MSKIGPKAESLQKLRFNSQNSTINGSKNPEKKRDFRLASTGPKEDNVADFIKKNRIKIEDMKKANTKLRDEIETEKKIAEKNNKATSDRILELQKMGVMYAKKIEHESKNLVSFRIGPKNLMENLAYKIVFFWKRSPNYPG